MRRLLLTLALVAALPLGAPSVARADALPLSDPVGVMKAARQEVAADDIAGAIRTLGLYVALHPEEAGPARLLGDLYYRVGKLVQAETTYRAILALYPTDKETHNRLGTVYATENRVDEAIAQFNASLPGTDSVPDLVALHQRKGDFDQYKSAMERVATTFPTDPDLQAEVGRLYAAIGQPRVAMVYYRRALVDDPQSLDALNWYGLAFMDVYDEADAIRQFEKCTGLSPQDYACVANTGAAYLALGQFATAEPLLLRARDLAPEQPEALVNLGDLADSRNDWKGAVTWYLRALSASPYSRDAYIDLGYEYENHGFYPQAEAVLVKGMAIDPTEGRLHVLLGMTYKDVGEPSLALAQFKIAETSDDRSVADIARQSLIALTDSTTPAASSSPH
ncbi:MAG TPA: tetratricopeptide repeat protein [Candidatus Baltobacteraceae bacterium]